MSVYNILVEGMDDLVFMRRLIEVARSDIRLPALKWTFMPQSRTLTLDKRKFGNAHVKFPNGDIVVLMGRNGVYFPEDLDQAKPAIKRLKLEDEAEDIDVTNLVGIFDADTSATFYGKTLPHGGYSARKGYIERVFASWGVSKRFYYFPNNGADGSLEDLAKKMVRDSYRFALDKAWPSYRRELRASSKKCGLQYYDSSAKCDIAQFAAAYDLSVAKDLYWLSALWNDAIFDWTIPEIAQLVQFLKGAVPPLFA